MAPLLSRALMACLAAAALVVLVATPAQALENLASVKVTPLLKTQTTWDGTPLRYPTGQAEVTAFMVEMAPGAETGWHGHPVPSFGLVLEGEIEVTLADGRKTRFKAGEAAAEVVHTLHNGRNVGHGPLRLVVFYAGTAGSALTVKPEKTPE